jgi:hypothetical protein
MSPGVIPRDLRDGLAIGRDGDVVRGLHEGDLGARLDHPAGADDAAVSARLDAMRAQPVEREEANGLFHANRSGAGPVRFQPVRQERRRALMLVPHADVRGDLQRLADRRLLELGRDDHRRAFGRNQRRGQPFAPPPLHTGEIDERASRLHEQCLEACRSQQPLRLGNALRPLGGADGRRQRGGRSLGEQWHATGQQRAGGCGHSHKSVPARRHRVNVDGILSPRNRESPGRTGRA